MKWIVIAVVVMGIIGALAVLIGSRLPRSHHATEERTFGVAPDVVWQVITNVESFPSWRRDIKSVKRLPDRNGRTVWEEHGRSGKITMAIDRIEPPRLLVSRIADEGLPFGGTWTYEITPMPGGSRLRITEDGEIYNPMFRVMARYVFGYVGTIRSYLSALKTHLDQSAVGG